jgi:hypothetical protein
VQSLKSLSQGYLIAAGLICLFNAATLIKNGDPWLGILYLLIVLLPTSTILSLKLKGPRQPPPQGQTKWRNLLFAFQGVALAFWSFDLLTTFYAIDITGLAIELNPLGWPLGILGAFAFYGPVLVFSYVLLFKLKETISFYAALPLTLLTLVMASMNLLAGAQNFQVFVDTAVLAANVRYGLLVLVLAINFVVPLALRKLAPLTQRPSLNREC